MTQKIKILIIITILISTLSAYSLSKHTSKEQNSTSQNLPTHTPTSHPLSILSLQKKVYESEFEKITNVNQSSSLTYQIASYKSDGLLLNTLLIKPVNIDPKAKLPVVIVNHGYIEPTIYSTTKSYINTSTFYANSGFVVFKPDYRGHAQSEGASQDPISRIGYATDVLNLISAIRKMDFVDPDRIYMYGHSMGGDVTLRVLEICPDCIKKASLWAPAVTVWPESYLYFSRNNASEEYEKRLKYIKDNFKLSEYEQVSSLANINLIKTPIIIHHGTKDESVPFSWGQDLHKALEKASKPTTFYEYPNDNHDISSNWSKALTFDVEFFNSTP